MNHCAHASIFVLAAALLGCPGDDGSTKRQRPGPQPRQNDPALVHTWKVPPGTSRIVRGDMGSEPADLGDALMQTGALPGLVHEVGVKCEAEKALPAAAAELAVRLAVQGGKLQRVEADPQSPTAVCIESAIRANEATFAEVPDGRALIRLELAAAGT
jgi:hypothetical protein